MPRPPARPARRSPKRPDRDAELRGRLAALEERVMALETGRAGRGDGRASPEPPRKVKRCPGCGLPLRRRAGRCAACSRPLDRR